MLLQEKRRSTDALRQQTAMNQIVELRQLDVIEKAFAQLRASNPWEYQAIQAVATPMYDEPYDPSEEAEAARIADRASKQDNLKESLHAEEAAALDDLFPGGFSG